MRRGKKREKENGQKQLISPRAETCSMSISENEMTRWMVLVVALVGLSESNAGTQHAKC
jgi:hypothetical protein